MEEPTDEIQKATEELKNLDMEYADSLAASVWQVTKMGILITLFAQRAAKH